MLDAREAAGGVKTGCKAMRQPTRREAMCNHYRGVHSLAYAEVIGRVSMARLFLCSLRV